jgi:hypothetical protein
VNPTYQLPGGLLQGAGLSAVFAEDQFAVLHGDYGTEIFSLDLQDRTPLWMLNRFIVLPSGGVAAINFDVRHVDQITLRCALQPGNFAVGRFVRPPGAATEMATQIAQQPSDVQEKLKGLLDFLMAQEKQTQKDRTNPF